MWTENTRSILFGQWLAWKVTIEHSIGPADGVKPVKTLEPDRFKGQIIIHTKKTRLEKPTNIEQASLCEQMDQTL